jgi:hypothetical protein
MQSKIILPKLYYKEYNINIKYKHISELDIERNDEEWGARKWGQRKLFIVEFYYLIMFTMVIPNIRPSMPKIKLVIYAGSSPGFHLLTLSKFFPKLKFILCDPRPPGFRWQDYPQFRYISGYYDIKVGQQILKDENVSNLETLFMSDIRDPRGTPSGKDISTEEKEKFILKNMDMQKKWTIDMNPHASMLKFRLPFIEGLNDEFRNKYSIIEYLDGLLLLQPYVGMKSTEARLIVTNPELYQVIDKKETPDAPNIINSATTLLISEPTTSYHKYKYQMREYDSAKLEKELYFFNVCVRPPLKQRVKDPELTFDPNDTNIIPAPAIPITEIKNVFRDENLKYEKEVEDSIQKLYAKIAENKYTNSSDIEYLGDEDDNSQNSSNVPDKNKYEEEIKELQQDLKYRKSKMLHHDDFSSSWDLYAEVIIWEYFYEAGGVFPDVLKDQQTIPYSIYNLTISLINDADHERERRRNKKINGWDDAHIDYNSGYGSD